MVGGVGDAVALGLLVGALYGFVGLVVYEGWEVFQLVPDLLEKGP